MRKIVTGAGLAVILLAFGCKTTKLVSSEVKVETAKKSESVVMADISRRLETTYYGDTISGRVPLPYLTKKPLYIPIESGGIKLELSLTDSSAEYRVISKPVARSTLSVVDSSSLVTLTQETASVVQIERESTKKSTWYPWWIWLATILAIAAGVIWVIIKKSIIPN